VRVPQSINEPATASALWYSSWMSITLPLTPEATAELQRRAAAAGTDVASYVLNAVREKLSEGDDVPDQQLSYDEWSGEFQKWLASHPSRNPNFDDCRDSIYD